MTSGPTASLSSASKTRRSLRGAAKQSNTRARDLELRIWTLLSDGKTPSAIARDVGIARQSVHRIIRRVERKYNQAIGATVERLKARQARTLWAVVDEATDAWERSKQPARRIRKETGRPGGSRSGDSRGGGRGGRSDGRTDLTRTEVQSRVGDPRYLTEAREALADLRKLYGLDAPKTGNSLGETPVTYRVEWGE
jgi:DNA-binding CsgD family transcriptional regulator